MNLQPPIAELTYEDKGPIVIVFTYILISTTLLFILIKLATTATLKRQFDWDDVFISVAALLGIAQSVLTERSAINGVGSFQDRLSPQDLDAYFQHAFASNILSIVVQALAKLSTLVLIQRLSAIDANKRKYWTLHAAVVIWAIFSIFAIAFQCGADRAWYYSRSSCLGGGAMWYPIMIINIATDLAIGSVFMPVVWTLQISTITRFRIAGLFGLRVIVVALTISQLSTLVPALRATDTTRSMLIPTVLGQWVMNASTLTAALPSLYRFLNELHSGPGFGGMLDRSQYELSSYSNGKVDSRSKKPLGRRQHKAPTKGPSFRPDIEDNQTSYTITAAQDRRESNEDSISIGHGSEDMIITRNVEWTVMTVDRDTSVAGAAVASSYCIER